jgi:hypothetical protein
MMLAQLGPSQVRCSFTDRSTLTILLVSSARSSVRPDPLHIALLSRYRHTREEKGYGKDEVDLRLVDHCGSSSTVGNDIR